MNEKDWTLLVTLAQERSLTRTAQKLYVTQPAVTRRLQQIERELGCAVVVRGARGVELSAEGEHLAGYAAQELERLRALHEYLDGRSDEVRGTLRLACANAYAKSRLPGLLRRFATAYPLVDVHVVTGHSGRMGRLLTSGEAQIAFVRGRFDWAEESFALDADPYYYVINAVPIDLGCLPELPQIRNVTDAPLEAELHRWWTERYRTPPRVSTVVDRSDICLEMVHQGLGYSLLSGLYIPEGSRLRQARIEFSSGEPLTRETRVCCRTSSLELRAVKAFWDFLHGEVKM
ncbi:MAG: LysR family transcriptional regulator [Pyramidobacter sp.]|nr:LysR family transcriptional regulator [Pyramidobacter sp.]